MLRKCMICGEVMGCYLGELQMNCDDNYCAGICPPYDDDNVSHGVCDKCYEMMKQEEGYNGEGHA